MDQIFSISDVPRIFILAFLEILLSADNAIVLGVISHGLAEHLRKRALFIGIVSAFFLRLGAIIGISYLFESIYLQLLGGIYLIYLTIRYFTKKKTTTHHKSGLSFWKTVILIELFDLIFAIDSIIAGIAFINANISKLWVVYLGGIIGLISMRWAASLFSTLLTHFPNLERSAYLMIGIIGLKLCLTAISLTPPPYLFWPILILLFVLGFYRKNS